MRNKKTTLMVPLILSKEEMEMGMKKGVMMIGEANRNHLMVQIFLQKLRRRILLHLLNQALKRRPSNKPMKTYFFMYDRVSI